MKKTSLKLIVILSISTLLFYMNISSTYALEQYSTRDEIPVQYKWNLTKLYKDEASFQKDVKKLKKLADTFSKKEKAINLDDHLESLLQEYFQLYRLFEKVYVYARLSFDVNMSDPTAQQRSNELDAVSVYVVERTNWFSNEIQAIPKKEWKKLISSNLLQPYTYYLKEVYEEKDHSLPKEVEDILIQTMPFLHAPSEIFTMMSKDLQLPSFKVKEEEYYLTPQMYNVYMSSDDRELRLAAFTSYYDTLGKYQDSFATILANIVKANNFFATTKKYDSALEASLVSKDIDPKVYTELINTVNDYLPLFHRYLLLKQKYTGLDEMYVYDLGAPPKTTVREAEVPIEEARKLVKDGLDPLGEEYTKKIEYAFDNNWIDVFTTKGKATGGYQLSFYDGDPSILINYQGSHQDVMTLAHELGHALHSYQSNKSQPYHNARYVTFTAEVASTLNEHLLHQKWINEAKSKEEKLQAMYRYLEDFRVTLFRQTQFAEFEKEIHETLQNGESLHAEAIKDIYFSLVEKYFGKDVKMDERVAMEWARVPHFFHSSFYTYQYATSFAASAALAEQLKEEGEDARTRISDNLLAAGGSKPPVDILKDAGVDMSNKKPIVQTMKRFEQLLDEFEEMLNE
ncbi:MULTISPECIES: oligoendopeptidase F [Bacillus]|uniref:oligoendopeptidase F n=1 Tax=Bacillus TaxID=1386 RepID=UPI000BB6BE2F|nr:MULTISPECIES: oligoendopeptidase F [Bacillus]